MEECEDYVLDEAEQANEVSEAVEPEENKPEISGMTSQGVDETNGEAVFCDVDLFKSKII